MSKRKPPATITIAATFDIEELTNTLASHDLSHEQLVAFVVSLDEQMADWDFTLMLCEHFEKLKAQSDAEMAGVADYSGRERS